MNMLSKGYRLRIAYSYPLRGKEGFEGIREVCSAFIFYVLYLLLRIELLSFILYAKLVLKKDQEYFKSIEYRLVKKRPRK